MKKSDLFSRSLVGMTMGARKRKARGWWGWESYRYERSRLRIGERLRPCPGCCACKSVRPRLRDLKRQYPVSARDMVARGTWVCGRILLAKEAPAGPIHDPDKHCDGSGVFRIES